MRRPSSIRPPIVRAALAAALLAQAATGALAAPAAASARAPAQAMPACRVVMGGGGRNGVPAGTDADFWNRLNFSFYDAAQYALSQTGRAAEGRFHLVASPEAARSTEVALKAAEEKGCDEVVRLSVYGDDTAHPMDVVFRIAVLPVRHAGSTSSLGEPVYQREYRYPVDEDVERDVHPADLGAKAVAGFLESAGAH